MHKALILGATGYVGSALINYCISEQISFVAIGRKESASPECLYKAIVDSGADYMINCAGYTGKPNVDACEINKTECLEGNCVLAGIVRQGCEMAGIPWGHVSSGCIYTGRGPNGVGFTEEDPPNFSFRQNNCSFYSGCKALGEELLAGAENCYIWRLRIPFENTANPRNYLHKVMTYDCLLDAENSLSHLDEFVAAVLDSFKLKIPYGTYNLTNPGGIYTRQVVDMVRQSGVCTKQFQFFDSESQFMSVAAKTPRSNCLLDSSKALKAGLIMSPVENQLIKCLENWKK